MKEVGGVPVSFQLFQSIITIYGFSLSAGICANSLPPPLCDTIRLWR